MMPVVPSQGQLHFRPQTIPICYDIQDDIQDMVLKLLFGIFWHFVSLIFLHQDFALISGPT